MSAIRAAGLALAWGVAAVWTLRTLEWMRGMRQVPNLLDLPARRQQARLSVIVPARNEGAEVADGLRSLLRSDDVDLEVIAVDDRSTDETGSVMDALAEEQRGPRIRYAVEHIAALPDGWLGKPHAMACGVTRATGEWLLFTDADVIYAPDALARALGYLARTQADHLVLIPTAVAASAGEAMMLPFLHVLTVWGPRLWRVPDPASPRDAVGVGAFNLIRRSAYDAIGGWASLRMEVIEDLRVGYVLKRAGFITHAVTGRGLVRIRWAQGAWGVVENLTKNLFAAFRFRLHVMMAGTAGLAILCLLPFAALGLGLLGQRIWLWPGILSLACIAALYGRYHRSAEDGPAARMLWIAAFPAATLLFLFAMVRSTWLTLMRGGVEWRGTFYPLRELREHAGALR
jgi:glycosyltransferase involved in cell wall biosynthesis